MKPTRSRIETLGAKGWCPPEIYVNAVPPAPIVLPVAVTVSVFLTNRGAAVEQLLAMNECEISTWVIEDAATGSNVAAEPPEIRCDMTIYTLNIEPGETVRHDDIILLNGSLLRDGSSYVIKYTYFGQSAEATFRASFVTELP